MTSSATVTSRYRPRGAAIDLLRSHAPEVLVSGPAGTGKSLACLWKLHFCAANVPGFRGLILRKTRASLTDSALVTFERDVLPSGHPALAGARRDNRHSYHYPNRSELVCGGLDKASRIMSTDFDAVYVQEAIELEEAEWEALTTRLRNGKLAYQQLLADTNPDRPAHWLKLRCDAGACRLLESRHEDNPLLWDGSAWTPRGAEYLARLDALTGARLQRLRFGRWVQAEGVVYEGYDAAIHVVDRRELPVTWPRLVSVDFGYVNPFVCQWWALDDDDRLYLYRELYHTQRLVEDHARQIKAMSQGEPAPVAVVCDHDAEDRATLERYLGWRTLPAQKDRAAGFQAVAARLKRQGDGRPRLFQFRDALVERDPLLAEAKKPCSTLDEWDGYVWNDKRADEPVKTNDHGMDATRYLCATLDGAGRRSHEPSRVLRV